MKPDKALGAYEALEPDKAAGALPIFSVIVKFQNMYLSLGMFSISTGARPGSIREAPGSTACSTWAAFGT